MLSDPSDRTIRYLRLSITESCPMRCLYCRPSRIMDGAEAQLLDGVSILTPPEIQTLVRHLADRHGLRKVRITGGEPTANRDLLDIISRIASVPALDEIVMTTNGLSLARQARSLADAGLDRVNVSLDSLDPQRFKTLTGVEGLGKVLAGLDAACQAGLSPIRLNTVVIRDLNEHEIPALVTFSVEHKYEIRFIELMPMGPLAQQWADRYVPAPRMRDSLSGLVDSWMPLPRTSGAAQRYRVRLAGGGSGVIGFIAPMSCPFCDRCDRMRVASDGTFFPCLMDEPAGSLLPALRPEYDPVRLDAILEQGLAQKRPVHPDVGVGIMTQIGG